jgi:hypothetical protein
MTKNELLKKLKDLKRIETEEIPGASLCEAIEVLISVCEFLLNKK